MKIQFEIGAMTETLVEHSFAPRKGTTERQITGKFVRRDPTILTKNISDELMGHSHPRAGLTLEALTPDMLSNLEVGDSLEVEIRVVKRSASGIED